MSLDLPRLFTYSSSPPPSFSLPPWAPLSILSSLFQLLSSSSSSSSCWLHKKKFKVVAPSFVSPPPTAVVVPAGEGYGSRRRKKRKDFPQKWKKGEGFYLSAAIWEFTIVRSPLRPLSHKTHFSSDREKGGRKECGHLKLFRKNLMTYQLFCC